MPESDPRRIAAVRPVVAASDDARTAVFHVVLHQPQIPNNTGNIGRTCVATGCSLHLIHPLAFDTSQKACRRAGLDYWPRLAPTEHDSWDSFERWNESAARAEPHNARPRTWMFSTKATRPVWSADLGRNDRLVFGNETAGLPGDLLAANPDSLLTLPMVRAERSLNLATAVCAVVYEGLQQLVAGGQIDLDDAGRLRL